MTLIRPAALGDAQDIARIYVDSWRSTYAGLLPDQTLLRPNAVEREARWWRRALARHRRDNVVYVAEDTAEGLIGFASGGGTRNGQLPYGGEIYALYVRDDFQGVGVGRRLFTVTSERLLTNNGPTLLVWVLNGNPARFFYENLGGKFVARRSGEMGGEPIEEIAYGWEDIREMIALGKSGESG